MKDLVSKLACFWRANFNLRDEVAAECWVLSLANGLTASPERPAGFSELLSLSNHTHNQTRIN